MPCITTKELHEHYLAAIDRLAELYGLNLTQHLTDAEQVEIAELRQRTQLMYAELERRAQPALALFA